MALERLLRAKKDLLAVAGEMIEAAEAEIAYLVPPILGFTSQYGFLRAGAKNYTEQWTGAWRHDLSFYYIDAVRELLDIGEDVRHVGNSQEVLMLVCDQKESISSINVFKNDPLLEDRLWRFGAMTPPCGLSTFLL